MCVPYVLFTMTPRNRSTLLGQTEVPFLGDKTAQNLEYFVPKMGLTAVLNGCINRSPGSLKGKLVSNHLSLLDSTESSGIHSVVRTTSSLV